jgi:hypothetical protein
MTTPFEAFRSPITLRTFIAGTYVNGRWVEGSYTDSTITASIQPLVGEELQLVPEDRRETETYKMYTSSIIKTITSANPDQVIFRSKTFEVLQVFPWQNTAMFFPVQHYKYICMRVNPLT